MNQPLFQQFAECVKAGKCDAFESSSSLFVHMRRGDVPDYTVAFERHGKEWEVRAHPSLLCHHIREWLTGRDVYWTLYPTCLAIAEDTRYCKDYRKGTQLDWHMQSVVDICAGKVTP